MPHLQKCKNLAHTLIIFMNMQQRNDISTAYIIGFEGDVTLEDVELTAAWKNPGVILIEDHFKHVVTVDVLPQPCIKHTLFEMGLKVPGWKSEKQLPSLHGC